MLVMPTWNEISFWRARTLTRDDDKLKHIGHSMSERTYTAIGGISSVADFKAHVERLRLSIPCDSQMESGVESPLAQPLDSNGKKIGNRFCIHPMEGWDGTTDGTPSDATIRRWRNFGLSGAKLIWGGEAVAVRHDARANPNQLLMSEKNKKGLAE